jgi:xylulokinase
MESTSTEMKSPHLQLVSTFFNSTFIIVWIEALDLLFQKMKNEKIEFENIKSISGSAQQHGSGLSLFFEILVYWKKGSLEIIKNLKESNSLMEQLKNCFVCESPIWMDSSTQEICDELEENIGGFDKLAEITGSRAYCRFTLSQIAKQFRLKNLENCERISLVRFVS